MKQHCRQQNLCNYEPLKCWFNSRSLQHENVTEKLDYIVDNEIETVIIKYCSLSESNSDSDVEQ